MMLQAQASTHSLLLVPDAANDDHRRLYEGRPRLKTDRREAKQKSHWVNVNKVEDQLRLVAKRLENTPGFDDEDIGLVEDLGLAIKDLESIVEDLKGTMEANVIQVCGLRHRLDHLPGEKKREEIAALDALKNSMQPTIDSLKLQLEGLQNECEMLEIRKNATDKEVGRVRDSHKLSMANFEALIEVWNEELASKANLQIKVNETRDNIASCRRKMEAYDAKTADELSAINGEREVAMTTRRDLETRLAAKKEVLAREQSERSACRKARRELETQLGNLTNRFSGEQRMATMMAKDIASFDAMATKLNVELARCVADSSSLAEKNRLTEEETVTIQRDYEAFSESMEAKCVAKNSELKDAMAENQSLASACHNLRVEIMTWKSKSTEEEKAMKIMKARLTGTLEKLQLQTEECAARNDENAQLMMKMEDMKETQRKKELAMEGKIEDMKRRLDLERQTILNLQGELDTALKEHEDIENDLRGQLRMANDTIDDQRKTRKRLQEENEMQMATLVERESKLVELKGLERKSRKSLLETRESLSAELAKLESRSINLRKEHAQQTSVSHARAEEITALEAQRDTLEAEHEVVKTHVRELDDQRFQLKIAIDNLDLDLKRTVQERVRMESDFEVLKVETKEKDADTQATKDKVRQELALARTRLEACALRADRLAGGMREAEERRKEMELRLIHQPKVTRTVKALARRNERTMGAESDLRDAMLTEFKALGAEKIQEIEEFKVEGERTDPQLRAINARFVREVCRFDDYMLTLGGMYPPETEEKNAEDDGGEAAVGAGLEHHAALPADGATPATTAPPATATTGDSVVAASAVPPSTADTRVGRGETPLNELRLIDVPEH